MAIRLDVTTATGEGQSFSPAEDFIVQVTGAQGALFDVFARVDAAADWALLGTIDPNVKFDRFAKMPFVKIAVRDNKVGTAAKAWTDQ